MTFENHDEAWSVLGDNFWDDSGLIRRYNVRVPMSNSQFDAIGYLCDEWDYETRSCS